MPANVQSDPLHDGYLYNGESLSPLDPVNDIEIVRALHPNIYKAAVVAADGDEELAGTVIKRILNRPARPDLSKRGRPILIDPADGPCEICAAHVPGQCDRCGTKKFFSEITDHTKHMDKNGFQSVKPGHFHLLPVLGVSGREAKWDEICIDCYRTEYTAVYGTKPPV